MFYGIVMCNVLAAHSGQGICLAHTAASRAAEGLPARPFAIAWVAVHAGQMVWAGGSRQQNAFLAVQLDACTTTTPEPHWCGSALTVAWGRSAASRSLLRACPLPHFRVCTAPHLHRHPKLPVPSHAQLMQTGARCTSDPPACLPACLPACPPPPGPTV